MADLHSSPRRVLPERQCDECPWSKYAPRGLLPPERFDQLWATEDPDGPFFPCHKSPQGCDLVCAGWLHYQRGPDGHNLNARLLMDQQVPVFGMPELIAPSWDCYPAMWMYHVLSWDLDVVFADPPDPSKRWLQCMLCGNDVIEPDDDGMFWSDQKGVCLECGTISWVCVDESYDDDGNSIGCATLSSEEYAVDAGQPRCDGSCDCMEEYVGKPCRLVCERAAGFGPLVQLQIVALPDLHLETEGRP